MKGFFILKKMKTYAEKLRDPRWQKKRLKILERDQWTCQCCASAEINLQVHHLKYTNGNPWDIADKYLVTLCEECHEKVSKSKFMSKIRAEITDGLLSDFYVLKTHVRYFEVEKLLTLKRKP